MTPLKILHYLAKPYSIPVTESLRALTRASATVDALCFAPTHLLARLSHDKATDDLPSAVAFAPDVVLCPGNYVHDAIPGIKVQLFHGLCAEKPGHLRIRGFFQVYCTPGPAVTVEFERLAQKHRSFSVIETGWPKMDRLFSQSPAPLALPGIHAGKKVILYAPTFSRKYTSAPRLLPALASLPREDEVVVVKLHDLHDRQEREALRGLPPHRFVMVDDPDITPCLKAADVMLSDTSSAVYEFALLKPWIVLVDPLRRDLPFISTHAQGVRTALDDAREHRGIDMARVDALMAGMHPFHDAGSGQRVLDRITDAAFLDKVRSLPKKRNWFRRLKLRWYGLTRRGYVK